MLEHLIWIQEFVMTRIVTVHWTQVNKLHVIILLTTLGRCSPNDKFRAVVLWETLQRQQKAMIGETLTLPIYSDKRS